MGAVLLLMVGAAVAASRVWETTTRYAPAYEESNTPVTEDDTESRTTPEQTTSEEKTNPETGKKTKKADRKTHAERDGRQGRRQGARWQGRQLPTGLCWTGKTSLQRSRSRRLHGDPRAYPFAGSRASDRETFEQPSKHANTRRQQAVLRYTRYRGRSRRD
jgi:hypothetical protein